MDMIKTALLLMFSLAALPISSIASTLYVIHFEPVSGVLPTAGSFIYDPIAGFSNFTVEWFGNTFDLTSAANAPQVGGSGCDGEASTPAFGFIMMLESATGCNTRPFPVFIDENPVAFHVT